MMEDGMRSMMMSCTGNQQAEQLRVEIHRLVEVVGMAYLDDLRWTVRQYAAKSLNEAMEDRKQKK